ncbi:MAG: DUF4476 domain-containing protein [Flavobacterium sp.]|uniref:DUF4476 domain-containing protein n=1 Tax=Flavobacterium sp. TaxID=239 RepID=UPI001206E641|nr:DUF4476 domain-containing protein [Flavobacterium sp.]RZJ68715.1 MAG: DUF4476 domain-containing protein [Flavobacterium sp.]
MKKITFLLIFTVFTSLVSVAQDFGHLTIFSEDGDKFFLVLNGEKINNKAQTNIRVEHLTQKYYTAKILFEDKTIAAVSTSNLSLTDADDVFQDVTYKLKRDKKDPKKLKLRFFSMADIVDGYDAPPSVTVFEYGNPEPISMTITETTTTTTTQGNGGGISMGASVPGVNVNISVQEPGMNGSVTQSTTTTTTTTASFTEEEERRPRGCRNGYAISPRQLDDMLASLRKQTFEDTRLKSAKQMIANNCLSSAQVAKMCQEFKFEDNKLQIAKFAFPYCVDPNNYYKVNDVFTFSSNVDELTEFVSRR